MTEVVTQERAASKRDKVRMVADDVVTANSLFPRWLLNEHQQASLSPSAVDITAT